jgi:hypothetical protein
MLSVLIIAFACIKIDFERAKEGGVRMRGWPLGIFSCIAATRWSEKVLYWCLPLVQQEEIGGHHDCRPIRKAASERGPFCQAHTHIHTLALSRPREDTLGIMRRA